MQTIILLIILIFNSIRCRLNLNLKNFNQSSNVDFILNSTSSTKKFFLKKTFKLFFKKTTILKFISLNLFDFTNVLIKKISKTIVVRTFIKNAKFIIQITLKT